MKRLLTTIAAVGLLAAAAPPAHAYHPRDFDGGCGFETVSEESVSGRHRYNGAMYVVVYATDGHGTPLPTASISVDCEIYVNGVLADNGMSASGVGVAVAAGTYSFEATVDDWVNLCERAVVDGEEIFRCDDNYDFPPQEFYDLLVKVFGIVEDTEAAMCAALGAFAPGVPGVLDIAPEGDVSLLGTPFLDCPPYQ